jgi:hypothetical protein
MALVPKKFFGSIAVQNIVNRAKNLIFNAGQGNYTISSPNVDLSVTLPSTGTTIQSESNTATLTNKSIDADSNTLTNIDDGNIKTGADIARSKLASGTANRVLVNDGSGVMVDSSITTTELGYLDNVTSDIQTQLNTNATNLSNHLSDTIDAHDASAISVAPFGTNTAIDAQAALEEIQDNLDNHISDAIDAHDASAISVVPTGNLAATEVQEALEELQDDIDNLISASQFDVVAVNSNTTMVSGKTYLITPTGANINMTLPTPVTGAWVRLNIKGSSPSNKITLVRSGSEQIDGVAFNQEFYSQGGFWGSVVIFSDGTNWFKE